MMSPPIAGPSLLEHLMLPGRGLAALGGPIMCNPALMVARLWILWPGGCASMVLVSVTQCGFYGQVGVVRGPGGSRNVEILRLV